MKLINQVWAFIPARSGSKSIRNKNLLILKKKPLIAHSLNVAKKCKIFKKIIFSSDSDKYYNIAKKFAKIYFHKRSKKISGDNTTDFEVFYDFVKNFKGNLPMFFVHLRPTTPFRRSKDIEKIVRKFIINQKKFSSLRSVSIMSNPSYKSVTIRNNKLFSPIFNSFQLDKINLPRQKYESTFIPNGYIDIIKTKSIIKGFLHGNKVMPYINKNYISDIDVKKDFEIARLIN
jgi:CMP-N-acetylneuraminic acid synthetase|tara:strand:- start:617 stop:1309 length:693 start_codon:yes stop_codon:yes gene_type:complete